MMAGWHPAYDRLRVKQLVPEAWVASLRVSIRCMASNPEDPAGQKSVSRAEIEEAIKVVFG